uniref:Purple acid phosphatase n=1 Tax=Thraustotheca clavata TaxID=74557 RepID=A0A0A7CM70_9STRA|nr:secreted protein [Thraustotheca clavata]
MQFAIASLVATAAVVSSVFVEQVHLGLATSAIECANGIAVEFASSSDKSMTVTYSTHGDAVKTATTTVESYSVVGSGYNYTSPFFHTALLCNLKPTTTYLYDIGQYDTGCGSLFSSNFVTAPAQGSDSVPTVFGIVGDIGSEHIIDTLKNMAAGVNGTAAQALIIPGDYAYANGEHEQWDAWYTQGQSVFSTVPTLGINGNHETIKGGGATKPKQDKYVTENYIGYIHRSNNPITAAQKKALRTYFSADVGLVHCVFLDDYAGTRGADKKVIGTQSWLDERNLQLKWLESDLSSVDRTKTPWVLVFKHNAYYNSWDKHQCQCDATRFEIPDQEKCWKGNYDKSSGSVYSEPHCANQAKFEDVYLKHGVNMVIAGHVHAYERTAPMAKNKIDPKNGVVYLTTGAGGHGNICVRLDTVPDWSVAATSEAFAATRLVATKNVLSVYTMTNQDNTVLDSFQLTKNGVVNLQTNIQQNNKNQLSDLIS